MADLKFKGDAVYLMPMFFRCLESQIFFVINCKNLVEIDYFCDKLSADPQAEMCGWLKDQFGLSWQVVPAKLSDLLNSKEPGKSRRVMQKVLGMKKLNIEEMEKA